MIKATKCYKFLQIVEHIYKNVLLLQNCTFLFKLKQLGRGWYAYIFSDSFHGALFHC